MSRKKQAKRKPNTRRLIAAVLIIGAVILGGLVLSRRSAPDTGINLRDTDTAFSIPTHVGEPAPAFTAIGADGQPYTVTPGDGRPKALIFYMGYG